MKKKLELLKLQIKSAFISIPKILLGTIVLSFLVVLVGIGINLANTGKKETKMQVAVVYGENNDDNYVKMAFDFIGSIDTVSTVCEFVWTDEDEAVNGLKSGKYTTVLLLPDNLIKSIMEGDNAPIEVLFSSEGVNNTSMVFREMLDAAGSDLSSAEAGVYSLDDLLTRNGLLKDFRSKRVYHEDRLNEEYFSYALDRSIYYKETDLSKTDGLTNLQFYVCTAVVMLLLLSGITCANNLKSDNKALSTILKAQGIHAFESGFCKTAGITLVYFTIISTVFILLNVARVSVEGISAILKVKGVLGFLGAIFGLLILLFAVFSFIYCIFKLVHNPVYSILVLFLVSMVCMYASGCFVSSALLPHLVREIGNVLPTAAYFRLTGQIINGSVTFGCLIANIIIAVVCQTVAAICEKFRRL